MLLPERTKEKQEIEDDDDVDDDEGIEQKKCHLRCFHCCCCCFSSQSHATLSFYDSDKIFLWRRRKRKKIKAKNFILI